MACAQSLPGCAWYAAWEGTTNAMAKNKRNKRERHARGREPRAPSSYERAMESLREKTRDPYRTMYGSGVDPGLNPELIALGTGEPAAIAHGTWLYEAGDRLDGGQGVLGQPMYESAERSWREWNVLGWARTDDQGTKGGRKERG